jgi:hypothetical protein
MSTPWRVVLKLSRVGASMTDAGRQFHWIIVLGKKENLKISVEGA